MLRSVQSLLVKIIHVYVLVLIAEGLQQADKLHVHLKQR